MSLHGRRSRLKELRVEAITCAVLLLVLLGLHVRDNPWIRPPLPDAQSAARTEQPTPSDALVVLPTVPTANSLEQWALDAAWLNALDTELGSARSIDAAILDRQQLTDVAWLVIPRRAAAQLGADQIDALSPWVEDGGVLILEQPEGPWNALIGLNPSGAGLRPTRRLTAFDSPTTRGDLREDILQIPLRTTLAPYAPPQLARGRDYRVVMEADGLPALVSIPHGRGVVLLVLLDLGRAATLMRQGTADNSFLVSATAQALVPLWTASRHSVADEALLTNPIPFADLLDRNLLYLADAHRPVGRIWGYPGTHRGALIATHSEAGTGERTEYLVDWEHHRGERSSLFIRTASLDASTLARMGRKGADLHLEFVPPMHPQAPMTRWELGRFSPVRRPMNLRSQRDILADDMHPYGPPRALRITEGLRPVAYFDLWRLAHGAGFALDSSLGPSPQADEQAWGYLFGTGRPYRPIDRNGHRFQLFSMPYQATDISSGYTLGRLRRLVVDSAEKYHTTVVIDWRADTMARRPAWDVLEGWRNIFDLARSQELWVVTLSEYLDFLFHRLQSDVRSTFQPEDRLLVVRARIVGPERFDGDVSQATPSIAFPARHDGRPVEHVTLNGMDVPASDLALSGDRVLHILAVPPGDHEVRVVWASPATDPAP